jgi:hypothetical protein
MKTHSSALREALFLALVTGVMGVVGFVLTTGGRAHASCMGPLWSLIDQEISLVGGVGDEERERQEFVEEFGDEQTFEAHIYLYLGSVRLEIERVR